MIDRTILIAMMADAYEEGLKAGQQSASMKEDPDFTHTAVRLFSQGLADMLAEPSGQSEH